MSQPQLTRLFRLRITLYKKQSEKKKISRANNTRSNYKIKKIINFIKKKN